MRYYFTEYVPMSPATYWVYPINYAHGLLCFVLLWFYCKVRNIHHCLIPICNEFFFSVAAVVLLPCSNMGRVRRWPRWIKKALYIGIKQMWYSGHVFNRFVQGCFDNTVAISLLTPFVRQPQPAMQRDGALPSGRSDVCCNVVEQTCRIW